MSGERLLQPPGGATGGGLALRAALVPEGAELPAAVLRPRASRCFSSAGNRPSDEGRSTSGPRNLECERFTPQFLELSSVAQFGRDTLLAWWNMVVFGTALVCWVKTNPPMLKTFRAFWAWRGAAATAEEEAGSCMKMWPWMRDLPSHIWAGRGWAYDQSGPRRLSSAGGAEGMQGVQVWESAGTSGQPAAQLPTAAPQSAAASGAVAAWAASNAVKPVRVLCKQQEKQSGVPGISWQRSRFCWQLQWTERDSNGASTRHIRSYTISSFMKDGSDEAAAEASALKAAKAFRAELVAEGRIKEKVRDESLTSEVPGVAFAKGRKKLDCSRVGSFDFFHFLVEIKLGFPPPP